MEFARGQFELDAPQGDGATMRTHMQRLARNTGRLDARLLQQCPHDMAYLWEIFNTMGQPATKRDGHKFISQAEMLAWQKNHRTRLTPWELETLRALDITAAQVSAGFNSQQNQSQ